MKLCYKIFASICAAMILFATSPVEAKIVMDKLPLLTYAETPVAVYDEPNGNKKGTIAVGKSLVLVKVIRPDGWAWGSYKVANKKKRPYRWFKMGELQGYTDFENYTDKATSDQDAYRTRSSMNLAGKISSGEDLIVVAKRGDKLKVIFKADGNFYRMGWVDNTALSKTSTSNTNDSTNSSDDLITDNDTSSDDSLTENSSDESLSNDDSDESESLSNDTEEEGGGDGANLPDDVDDNLLDDSNDNLSDDVDDNLLDDSDDNLSDDVDDNLLDDSNDNLSDDSNDNLPEDVNNNSTIGDVNNDGIVDALDIILLQKYLKDNSTPIAVENADINADSFISLLDVNVLLNLLRAAGKGTGDVNGDGKIDSSDVQALSDYLAEQTATINRANSDMNGDGSIDDADLKILQEVIAACR